MTSPAHISLVFVHPLRVGVVDGAADAVHVGVIRSQRVAKELRTEIELNEST